MIPLKIVHVSPETRQLGNRRKSLTPVIHHPLRNMSLGTRSLQEPRQVLVPAPFHLLRDPELIRLEGREGVGGGGASGGVPWPRCYHKMHLPPAAVEV